MTKPSKIILEQFELGPLQNFLYFIGDPLSKEIAVVDPAWDVDFLVQQAQKLNYKVTSVLLTHGHPDHVNGLAEILSLHNVPAFISRHEATIYKPRHKNLKEVAANEKLRVGNLELECLHTPGHSPGCQCFYSPEHDILISGDTIFIDGCGRCDLPGSDPKQMYHSLDTVIMKLPDQTVLYPGHNYGPLEFDTLANQKRTNPYLQYRNLKEFLGERMGMA